MRGKSLPAANSSQPDWREASLKPDQFRLTVSRVVDESDQLVARITIETLQPQWQEISSRGTTWLGDSGGHASSGVVNNKSGPDGYYSVTNTLTATQIAYRETQLARCNLAGGSIVRDVPIKTPLAKVLVLSAKDGIYSLHKPLVIGQQFGVDVQLVVGERSKVESLTMKPNIHESVR